MVQSGGNVTLFQFVVINPTPAFFMSHYQFRRTLIVSFFLALLLLCLGCQTANGFGKDMEKAGEKIQDGTK